MTVLLLYTKTLPDLLTSGDERTAEDAYQSLQGFLERFPEYAGRPFWVAGESYGGHYVPNLALKVCFCQHSARPCAWTPFTWLMTHVA